MRKLIFLVGFFHCLVLSMQSDPYELAAFGGEPSSVIGGCVSAISGDYFFSDNTLVIRGHQPIQLTNNYISRRGEETFAGWQIGDNYYVANLIVDKSPLGKIYYLEVPEKSGVKLVYTDNLNSTSKEEKYRFRLIGTLGGLTNCSRGEISARLNLLNNVVYRDSKDLKQIIVDGADGSKRCYRCKVSLKFEQPVKNLETEKEAVPFYLCWEILPNGNIIDYDYEKIHGKWFIRSISTKSNNGKQNFSWVRFDYNYPDKAHLFWIKATTSDNQVLQYTIDPHQKNGGRRFWLLKSVLNPAAPNEEYNYWAAEKSGAYLCDKFLPNGRRLRIDYYGDSKRVAMLQAPIGEDGSLRNAFLIHYELGKYGEKGGHTNVFDAEGNLTQYQYDKNFMLTSQKRFIGEDELFSEDLIHWQSNNWIKGKTLLDEKGNPLFAYKYHYDSKGNVIQEDFWGNLTGDGEKKLIRNGNELPHVQKGECYSITREFHPNNLLYREIRPNGSVEEYHYVGETDLLYAKFIYDGGGLRERYFFLYEGSILIKEISDDGSSHDINNLQNVTQRLIKNIVPRREQTFYGLPAVIEEKYFDLKSSQEVLLRKQEIKYNSRGLVSEINHYDQKGKNRYTLTYSYDGKGRLISQTDPLGRTRTIQPDANDNPLVDNDPNEAFAIHNKFDFSNRLIESIKVADSGEKQQTQNRYNLLSQVTDEKNEQGNITRYEYDPFGHVKKMTLPMVTDEGEKGRRPTIQRKYNALGQVSVEIDPEGNKTEYFYTSRGKPYRIIHPDGNRERILYNIDGEIRAHVSPEDVMTFFIYDYKNRITSKKKVFQRKVISEEKFIYNAFHLIEKIDPDGVSTHYSYNGAGQKVKEETEGRVTLFSYDDLGRLVKIRKVIDQDHSQVVIKTYDLLDRVIKELELDEKGSIFGFTNYSYDDFSNKASIKKEVHVGNAFHYFEYDSFRRLIKEINPLGDTTTITYNDQYKDKHGQTVIQKTTRDPKGHQTVETFNTHGSISTLEKFNTQRKLLLRENFYYNLNGKKVKQVSELFDPQKVIVKTWKYDSRGRVIELKESDAKITRYRYTLDGHLKELIKPDGVMIAYTYDGLGRQTSIKTSDGSCHYTLEHDKMGNIIQSIDQITGQRTVRTYSHFGELLHETLGNKLTLNRTYDHLSRRVELSFADESKVQYQYDPFHLKNVKRIDSNGDLWYEHTYDMYDHSHNLISESHPGSLGSMHHQIDLLNRRVRTDSVYSTEQITDIDSNGNVLKYYQRRLEGEEEITEYSYDDLDQLSLETGHFAHNYAYDSHHNRVQKDNDRYELDSLHQLHSVAETTYDHDYNGNRIAARKQTHEIHYSYDGLDRLIQIHSGSKAVRYTYDSWGRCLTRTYLSFEDGEWHPTLSQDFLYDDQNELGIYPIKIRILGQGKGGEIGAAISIETPDDFYVPFHDLYGNVVAILDWDGNHIESYRFSSFGEEEIFTDHVKKVDSFMNPWRYQSKRKMGGLVNFGRRFYDPETGRWLSPDPKGFSEGPNLYQFVRNNPLIYFDLYGLSVESGDQYSVKRFGKDLGYVAFYTWRRTLEDYATGNLGIMNVYANLGKALGNVISGNTQRPVPTRSQLYTIAGKKHLDVDFYLVNGIFNDKNEALKAGRLIQNELNGYEVKVMHNNTHGFLDLIDFAAEKMGISTRVCDVFHEELKKTLDAGKIAEVQAHSEAHAISRNAFSRFSREERNRIGFHGYASADIMPGQFVGTVDNSYSGNDLVAFFANPINCIGSAMFNDSHVQVLKPQSYNPIKEHMLMSPVNLDRMEDINRELRREYNLN